MKKLFTFTGSDLLRKSWLSAKLFSRLQNTFRRPGQTLWILLLLITSLLSYPPAVHAASPPDDYHFNSFFPLLRFIPPGNLKVLEHLDISRTYEYTELIIISQATSCNSSAECVTEYQHCGDNGCGGAKTGSGICNQPDPESSGTCQYDQTPTCGTEIGGSDYASPEGLIYPKYQNEWQRYDYQGTDNAISNGTHNLAIPACDRAELQLITLAQAAQTKEVVAQTEEWPLGWVDWEYRKTKDDLSLIEIWNGLGNLQAIGRGLTAARDVYLLSAGENIVEVNSLRQELCQQIRESSNSPSIQALLSAPLYPPATIKGYARCSVCVEGICNSSKSAEGLYTDLSVRGALAAAIYNLQLTFGSTTIKSTLKDVISRNPLLPYTQIASSEALPSNIAKKLRPTVSGLPSPFTLSALGDIYDYQTEMDKFGYKLMDKLEGVMGGAMPTSIGQKILHFVYGIVSKFVDLKFHLIIIPEPMAQSLFELQSPVYQTRNTTDEQQKDAYQRLTTLIDSTSPLSVYKPLGPGETRSRFTYLTCADPEYSSPQETIIADYALGTRIGCFDESESAPSGEINCDQTVPEQNLPGLSIEDGKRYTDALFAGCVGNSQWMQCHNDVIKRARESGVDPLFTLAIWIHESGASNYICGEQYHGGIKIQDFGYNVPELAENFTAQIVGFLALPTAYEYCGKDMNNFIAKFWFGHCYDEITPEEVANVAIYIDAIEFIYSVIAPGMQPPAWPQIGPYVPSNPNPGGGTGSTTQPGGPSSPTNQPGSKFSGFFPEACGDGYLKTALGCIPYNRDAFTSALLSFIVGVAGAASLVIMLIATVQIVTAGGNAEQLQKGKELFTSAIIGLLFLIFSVSLLRIIAGDIINLPGF